MTSIFTQIADREIPAHIVYEDENTMAIMDIHPIQTGHVLVFTKKEVESFEQLDEGEFAELMRTAHKVGKKIKEVYNPPRVGVIIEGFDVPHVHVKVLPIQNEVELRHIPELTAEPDHESLEVEALKLQIK